MAEPTFIPGDVIVGGKLMPSQFEAPDNSIKGAAIDVANPIPTSKMVHRFVVNLAQKTGLSTATERKSVYIAKAAGTLVAAKVGFQTAITGTSTVVVNVLKNNVSVLSSALTVTNATTAYTVVNCSIDPAQAAYATSAFFEVSVSATVGTGATGQGLIVELIFDEAAA